LVNFSISGSTFGGYTKREWETMSVSGQPLGDDNFIEKLEDTCSNFVLLRKNLLTG
jgi:hypothetical protein